jgi:hypothetical protein
MWSDVTLFPATRATWWRWFAVVLALSATGPSSSNACLSACGRRGSAALKRSTRANRAAGGRGDAVAERALAASPRQHRIGIATTC